MTLFLNSPFRPPHWRTLRVNQFLAPASTLRLSRKRDDPLIWRAVRYLRKRDRLRSERGRNQWREENRSIADALDRVNQNDFLGMQIQARVLAGQTDYEIALATGLDDDIVADYIGLRFDIREKLHARGWIINQVIRLHETRCPITPQLFYLHSYLRGALVVDAWIDWFGTDAVDHDLKTQQGRNRAAIDLFVQAHQADFAQVDGTSLLRNLDLILQMSAQHTAQRQQGGGFAQYVRERLADFVKSTPKSSDFASQFSAGTDETFYSSDFMDAVHGESGQNFRTLTPATTSSRQPSDVRPLSTASTQ